MPIAVLDGLTALVDKSLLRQRVTAGEPRFAMLTLIREYAREKLEAVADTLPHERTLVKVTDVSKYRQVEALVEAARHAGVDRR